MLRKYPVGEALGVRYKENNRMPETASEFNTGVDIETQENLIFILCQQRSSTPY